MELSGAKILIDAVHLNNLQGRGFTTYSKNLIKAYEAVGALPSVLISGEGTAINTDLQVLFKKMNYLTHLKYGLPLLIKNIFGIHGDAFSIDIPRGNIIDDLSFINDVSLYSSPGCYSIAKSFRKLGLELTIAPIPEVDVWHTTVWLHLKVKGALRVSTIHDIIPLRMPQLINYDTATYIEEVRDIIKDSMMILSVSEHTKNDIIEFFDVDPDRIFVNYPYVSPIVNAIAEDKIYDRLISLDLKYGKYILYLGVIEPRKNIRRIIEAYLSLSIDIPLVLAGKKEFGWEGELAQFDIEDNKERVRVLDYVSEVDKYILYKGAMFFVFPSLAEGFGAPPIEAMSLGLPVLTSSMSCLPEVCGEAALYVDPYDVRDIAAKIGMMINDEKLRQRLITLGYERAKFFSMDRFINGLKDAYSRL